MTAATTAPEVFVRKASGLVRVMSPTSAFVYNILTMGLIFPWTYLWAPGALPGGQLVWGILLAMVLEIPIAFAYVWLSTAMPRSGGDYVFQSRIFGGGVAFTVVMSGYVIWILQWVALSGWLLAELGFAPLFTGLGAYLGNSTLADIGAWFVTPWGVVITSIVNALASLILLVSGFKNYVRVQWIMFVATLIAFATMIVVLFAAAPNLVPGQLDAFSKAIGGPTDFYNSAVSATQTAGIDIHPPFSLLATLLVAPIAWTSLQWATYSAQQNGEIKDARSFSSQVKIILGSLIATGVLLAVLAVAVEHAVGDSFLTVAGAGYWSGVSEATLNGSWLWPNLIAVALSASPLVVLLIGIGYILNSFQIVNNCYIGMTRVMVAMSLDRVLPEWVSRVNERFHTPVNAHVLYFVASIPVILLYNLYGSWAALTLGVTFACGYVFVITCLAGALLPYRAKDLYEASPGSKYTLGGIPWVTILGLVGFVTGGLMVLLFIFNEQLGLTTDLARIVVIAVLVVSAAWYLIVKAVQRTRGINVEYAFKEIPPE
ncbi:MAG TPA: APC family permease [Candidatus Limnocylindrales bacterium]|nr:APC family permease [Candidatus Limnocylindrales bacterium]